MTDHHRHPAPFGVAAAPHPALTHLQRHWTQLRGPRDMPTRAEIAPQALSGILRYAFLLDRPRPGIARFRLAGSHLAALMGMELRGMPLRAFFELPDRARLMTHVEALFATPCALQMSLISDTQGRAALPGQMLLLPLRDGMGGVTRAIGAFVTEGGIGLPPRRFRLLTADLRPIDPAGPMPAQAAVAPRPAPGTDGRPRLYVIKGGRSA